MPANPMQAAFEALPDSHRWVLQLARSGASYAEIAERLGVTPHWSAPGRCTRCSP